MIEEEQRKEKNMYAAKENMEMIDVIMESKIKVDELL